MDIVTRNKIQFILEIEKNSYSFVVPHGSALEEAIEACGYFLSGLTKMKIEHEEKEKVEETNSEEVKTEEEPKE